MNVKTGTNIKTDMKIAWIGTGIMGGAMCARLLDAGYTCFVYNRTPEKAQPLLNAGAHLASSPADAASKADVVFTMVGFPQDVEEVILHPETGVLAGFRRNPSQEQKIVADMSTSRPSLAEKIALIAEPQNVWSLDAPVSGGDVGAKNGTLSIMVGGNSAAFEQLAPIWKIFGTNICHQGAPGAGQHTKMMNQILIAGNMLGMCEALRYAEAAGLNLKNALSSVSSGAAGSWSLSNLAPRILNGNLEPGFKIAHFLKDLRIALDEAAARHLETPAVQLAERVYSELNDAGFGAKGTQALIRWPECRNEG